STLPLRPRRSPAGWPERQLPRCRSAARELMGPRDGHPSRGGPSEVLDELDVLRRQLAELTERVVSPSACSRAPVPSVIRRRQRGREPIPAYEFRSTSSSS